MVGERDALEHARTEPFGERKEALRIGDTGKGDDWAVRQPGGIAARAYARGQHRPRKAAPHALVHAGRGRAVLLGLAHDDGVDEPELEIERRTQGTGRNDLAVAEAPPAVDHRDRQVLRQRRVLQAVVHDDGADLAPARLDGARARGAIAGNERRSDAGEQQRLIAEAAGGTRVRPRPRRGPRRCRRSRA